MKGILLGVLTLSGGIANANLTLVPPPPTACSQMILNEAKQIEAWTHTNFVSEIKGDRLVLKKANGSGNVSWKQTADSQTIEYKFSGTEDDSSSYDPNGVGSAGWRVDKSGDGYTITDTQTDSSGKPYSTATRHYKETNGQCTLDQSISDVVGSDKRAITYDQALCDRINQFLSTNSKKIEECQSMMSAVEKIVTDRQSEISKNDSKDKKTYLAVIKMPQANKNVFSYAAELTQECSGSPSPAKNKKSGSSSSSKAKASSGISGTN